MDTVLIILLCVLGLYVLTTVIVAIYTLKRLIRPYKPTYEQCESDTYRYHPTCNNFDAYKAAVKEDVYITNGDGQKLKGVWIPNETPSDDSLIIIHGITSNIISMARHYEGLRNHGLNLLFVDLRYFGESEGKYCAMGDKESYDIALWMDYIRNKQGKTGSIGLFGESMGAATLLNSLIHGANPDYAVSDSGFSSEGKLLKILAKGLHTTAFPSMWIVTPIVKLTVKSNLYSNNPIEGAAKTDIPIFFIHGDADNFIPCSISEEMYKVTKNPLSRFSVFHGASHVKSCDVDRERYYREIFEFIDSVEKSRR